MSVIKLAVYGALGYLAYQMFFADMPGSMSRQGGGGGGRAKGGAGGGGKQRQSSGGSQGGGGSAPQPAMSGPGGGMDVNVHEADGGTRHTRVGRGVV